MDMKKRIIRVFPTKTNATPTDELVRIRETPSFFDEADEVHVSVTFTWDIPIAEWLAKQWEPVATVKIGGPAYNEPGGDFIPGMYMRHGSRQSPDRIEQIATLEHDLKSSFFGPGKIPAHAITSGEKYPTINDVVQYVKWQNATGSLFDDDTATSCMSFYGLCE